MRSILKVQSRSAFGWAGRLVALGVVALASGCAAVKMPESVGSAANQQKLRELAPVSQGVTFGEFTASTAALAADKGLSVRGSNTIEPRDGSFARQLRDQLVAEFKAAGLLSGSASLAITGVVTDNQLEAPIGTGKGRLAARIQVRRAGTIVFDKEIVASATWDSPFVGATAIPAAFNQYGALYPQLAGKLIDDPEFRAALRR